jgi:hypothetical protein
VFKIVLVGTGVAERGLSVNAVSIPPGVETASWQTFTGTLTVPITEIPNDLVLKVYFTGGDAGNYVMVDDIIVYSDWTHQIVGPNEMDALDGLAPVATVVQPGGGQQSQLVFFKDSITRTAETPPENQLVRFSYRSAGQAVGRAVDGSSLAAEATKWGDDGIRAVVRTDLTPKPRTALECEMAAAAIVQENSYTHYEGEYTQWSTYFTAEPKSGSIIKFTNFGSATISAEEISEVVTTLEDKTSGLCNHTVTFGKADHVRRLLSRFDSAKGNSKQKTETAQTASVDYRTVGSTFAADVTKPILLGWDVANLYMDAGQDLGTDGAFFEVRYTDAGWGADDGKNLVVRSATRTFTVPRDLRGRVFYVRQANIGNLVRYSEDLAQGGVFSGVTITKTTAANPDGNLSTICSAAFNGSNILSAFVNVPATYTNFCWSFSAKGTAGKVLSATLGSVTTTFTLNGRWQRFSVPVTIIGGGAFQAQLRATTAATVELTRYSVEPNTLVERSYSKTNSTTYGPVSRYAALVHISFPLVQGEFTTDDITVNIDADATLEPLTQVVRVDATSGPATVTLPAFDLMAGKKITIVKIDSSANEVTVVPVGDDTIAGQTSVVLAEQYRLLIVEG